MQTLFVTSCQYWHNIAPWWAQSTTRSPGYGLPGLLGICRDVSIQKHHDGSAVAPYGSTVTPAPWRWPVAARNGGIITAALKSLWRHNGTAMTPGRPSGPGALPGL